LQTSFVNREQVGGEPEQPALGHAQFQIATQKTLLLRLDVIIIDDFPDFVIAGEILDGINQDEIWRKVRWLGLPQQAYKGQKTETHGPPKYRYFKFGWRAFEFSAKKCVKTAFLHWQKMLQNQVKNVNYLIKIMKNQ
jgi:hypothetical protein